MVPSSHQESVKVRPYARLLTMLGEQLIKNDRIALVELIKNSYDADATSVTVDFTDFTQQLVNTASSRIVLTDDGVGMAEPVLRMHWLNPATPIKTTAKRTSLRTGRGRVLQGEKGIGRFSMFKLGTTVELVTRSIGDPREWVVGYDLSFLDEADSEELFLEDVEVTLASRSPSTFDGVNPLGLRSECGTQVSISGLRSRWTRASVERAYSDVARLQPLLPLVGDLGPAGNSPTGPVNDSFVVSFVRDGNDLGFGRAQANRMRRLFEDRAVLKVRGHFDQDSLSFLLEVNGQVSLLELTDAQLRNLKPYKDRFGLADSRVPECGSFDFSFFVFDLLPTAPIEYRLDGDEKKEVRDHRIYLYRDGVRVLPYGDADDDWLQLDVLRGTQAASRVLSNDQTVGFAYISQELNPALRDKTNREGLIESGLAPGDFIALLQIAIMFVRRGPFERYLRANEKRQEASRIREQATESGFADLLGDARLPSPLVPAVRRLAKSVSTEREYFENRAQRTEDLAAVGLSVEAASHDVVAVARQALGHARLLAARIADEYPGEALMLRDLEAIVDSLSFVSSRIDDIQGLFVSTRRAPSSLKPFEFVKRATRMYSAIISGRNVDVMCEAVGGALQVKATEAALLQVFVNLLDNALYWLDAAGTHEPKVLIQVDAVARWVVVADNGPGVPEEDIPFIFEPFYSGKGEAGKGLGLYIARQVGARTGFSVNLIVDEDQKLLPGANFVVSFNGGDESVDRSGV